MSHSNELLRALVAVLQLVTRENRMCLCSISYGHLIHSNQLETSLKGPSAGTAEFVVRGGIRTTRLTRTALWALRATRLALAFRESVLEF